MSDDKDVRPVRVFDQTNGLSRDDDDDAADADRTRRRSTRKAGEGNVALGAHQAITGAQGGF